jgi:beta-lactamase regulating signal transducer with metallopeptidase domain
MVIDRVLQVLGALLAASLVRGLVVLAVAFTVTALAKRLSPEARHLVWFAAILAFILIPLAWIALPPLPIGVPIAVQPSSDYRLATAPVLAGSEYARLVDRAIEQRSLTRESSDPYRRAASLVLAAVWLSGVLALVARLLIGHIRVHRLTATADRDPRLQATADDMSAALSGRRRPRVFSGNGCGMPFTFGVLRPAIVLPAEADRWPAARIGSVIAHEVAHVARHDLVAQSIAYVICVLFWFVPPVWLAYATMVREAEACCDQQVINRGFRGREYARDILDLVRGSVGRLLHPVPVAAMAKRTMVRQRVETVLRLKPGRGPLGVRGTFGVLAVCLCCLAPIVVLTGAAGPAGLAPGDPFVGTWINAEDDQSARALTPKTVVTPDNRRFCYRHLGDRDACGIVLNTYEDVWVDQAGNRWYKIRVVTMAYPSGAGRVEGFNLARVDAAGAVMEMAFAEYGYPATLEPIMSPKYAIYYRQP